MPDINIGRESSAGNQAKAVVRYRVRGDSHCHLHRGFCVAFGKKPRACRRVVIGDFGHRGHVEFSLYQSVRGMGSKAGTRRTQYRATHCACRAVRGGPVADAGPADSALAGDHLAGRAGSKHRPGRFFPGLYVRLQLGASTACSACQHRPGIEWSCLQSTTAPNEHQIRFQVSTAAWQASLIRGRYSC